MASFKKRLKTFLLDSENQLEIDINKLNPYFDLEILLPIDKSDDIRLPWNSIIECIKSAISKKKPYIGIITEKKILNHKFDPSFLEKNIKIANRIQTNILFCNAYEQIDTILPLTENLLWIDKVENTDFFLVFEKCYNLFLEADTSEYSTITEIISFLTSNKLLLYPMILNNNVQEEISETNKRINKIIEAKIELENI